MFMRLILRHQWVMGIWSPYHKISSLELCIQPRVLFLKIHHMYWQPSGIVGVIECEKACNDFSQYRSAITSLAIIIACFIINDDWAFSKKSEQIPISTRGLIDSGGVKLALKPENEHMSPFARPSEWLTKAEACFSQASVFILAPGICAAPGIHGVSDDIR